MTTNPQSQPPICQVTRENVAADMRRLAGLNERLRIEAGDVEQGWRDDHPWLQEVAANRLANIKAVNRLRAARGAYLIDPTRGLLEQMEARHGK